MKGVAKIEDVVAFLEGLLAQGLSAEKITAALNAKFRGIPIKKRAALIQKAGARINKKAAGA